MPSSSDFWVSATSLVNAVELFLDGGSWSWLVLSTCSSEEVDDFSMDEEMPSEEGSVFWEMLFRLTLVGMDLGSNSVGVTSLASLRLIGEA